MTDLKPQRHIVEWRDEYCGGIDEVDQQHKHLFFLVKEMSLHQIDETLDELANYVFSHFATEQKLMEECSYPNLVEHHEVHDGFVLTVAQCIASDQAWDNDRIRELRAYLNAWLINHIMVEDKKFSLWYKEYEQQLKEQSEEQKAQQGNWFSRFFKH